MLDKQLLEIIACPKCKGDLEYDKKNDKLICNACRLKYLVKEDIPIMLIDEAEKFQFIWLIVSFADIATVS